MIKEVRILSNVLIIAALPPGRGAVVVASTASLYLFVWMVLWSAWGNITILYRSFTPMPIAAKFAPLPRQHPMASLRDVMSFQSLTT